MNRAVGILHALAMAALVAGCGGGGGDSGTPATGPGPGTIASADSFPLQDGYRARLVAGSSDSFAISDSCSGTAQITNGAATATTFEGIAGFGILQTSTVTFTNCLPATSTASGTTYYDANYAPIGTTVTGVEYSVLSGTPASLPASVKVGDTAVYAMLTTYTDSTPPKGLATGKRELSYTIEADTASTVIVDLVAKTSDISDHLLLTQQTRYRMAADGSLTMVSIDVDYPAPNAAHLHYTKTGP
jgi:hypothetical protein